MAEERDNSVIQRDPTPINNMHTRASSFNLLWETRAPRRPVKTLLFARGHCVERFAVYALRDNCQEEQTMVEGMFVSDDALHLQGRPMPLCRIVASVCSSRSGDYKEVDISMSLEWVPQCHVYMILTDHTQGASSPSNSVVSTVRLDGMLRVNMNPDIKALLENRTKWCLRSASQCLLRRKSLQAGIAEYPLKTITNYHVLCARRRPLTCTSCAESHLCQHVRCCP